MTSGALNMVWRCLAFVRGANWKVMEWMNGRVATVEPHPLCVFNSWASYCWDHNNNSSPSIPFQSQRRTSSQVLCQILVDGFSTVRLGESVVMLV